MNPTKVKAVYDLDGRPQVKQGRGRIVALWKIPTLYSLGFR
jgi:hypothetical protein